MNVRTINMGSHDKGMFSLSKAHGRLISNLVRLLRRDFSGLKRLPNLICNHIMRLGSSRDMLIEVFKSQFAKLNPERAGEAEAMLRIIRQELDNDDIGESFYKRLKAVSPVRLIDFEHPENNTFHCSAEFTCKRDEDEFRPDITLFVNGLPLVFIEVKKPNNIGGMVAEAERMNKLRFFPLF